MSTFRAPMTCADAEDLSGIGGHWLASLKIDGYRVSIQYGVPYTRNGKPIPNKFIRESLTGIPFDLDGEVIVGDINDPLSWNNTSEGFGRHDGEPDFTYHVFDIMPPLGDKTPFSERLELARLAVESLDNPRIKFVFHTPVYGTPEIRETAHGLIERGYEGLIIRSPNGMYKHGRATFNEGTLMKVKLWYDCEATVLGYAEGLTNTNPKKKNALGHTERSSHKAGKVPNGTMGALKVRMDNNVEFSLSAGPTEADCDRLWFDRHVLVGKRVTFKHRGLHLKTGAPKHPIMKGLRLECDDPHFA